MNRQVATELNNLGVYFLEVGDLRRSLDLFRDALKYTMGEVRVESPEELRSYAEALSSYAAAAAQHTHQNMKDATERSYPQRKQDLIPTPSSSSTPFVHSQGINIISSPTAYSPDVLINTTVVSGIVIFNLAIVYHLKGLEGNNLGVMRLLKAISLYQKSHLLLSDAGVPLGATGNPVIDMLSMALFNNMAQVSFELALYEESRHYFDNLVRFARTVSPQLYGNSYIGAILDQQKSNYLLNAIILQVPKLAPAA
jgi:tetratricopeptide (TPR) repeat protein